MIKPRATVTGAVKDSVTGLPVTGADVYISGNHDTTDSSGEYTLNNVMGGSQTLQVRKNSYRNYSETFSVVMGEEIIKNIQLIPNSAPLPPEPPGWVFSNVEENSYTGDSPSVAFDHNGLLCVAYMGFDSEWTSIMRFASFNGANWNVEGIDSNLGYQFSHTSLCFDASNNPMVAYFNYSSWDLKFAKRIDSSWNVQTLDSAGLVGQNPSMAVDSDGNPAIADYDYTNANLKMARFSGTSWNIETVASEGNVGQFPSIKFDASNKPVICYFSYSDYSLNLARYDGSSWTLQKIEDIGYQSNKNFSLAINSAGNPCVSYCWSDENSGKIKYASYDGASWDFQVVDSIGESGVDTSLVLDSDGNPMICYRPDDPDRILMAQNTGSGWDIQTVESVSGLISLEFPSLTLDPQGNPCVVYKYWDGESGISYPRVARLIVSP